MRVLIAEDEKITNMLLLQYLRDWGHDVETAENGQVAWQKFETGKFHIVISDWNMPEMDGIELVQKIRGCPAEQYCYTIMLTARTDKADLISALDSGADDFLSKPFDRNELRARIRAGERMINLQRELEENNKSLIKINKKMSADLMAAAKLQRALLPKDLPKCHNARFAWNFQPCDELAGDNLNVFQLDEQQIGFYVADVSGHGVAASLLSVTINQVLSPQKSDNGILMQKAGHNGDGRMKVMDPLYVVQQLNRRFPMEEFDGNYFTILYGVLNTQTCEFRFISAGHPLPISISKHGTYRIPGKNGFPIGWLEDGKYQETCIQLKPGERIFIYTDGVSEAKNPQQQEFGEMRLIDTLTKSVSRSINDCVSETMSSIESWCDTQELEDDISMLVLEIAE